MAFIDYFSELEDPRSDVILTHYLLDVLFLTIAAMLSRAEDLKNIEDFDNQKLEWLRKFRLFEYAFPIDDTIAIDGKTLSRSFINGDRNMGSSKKCVLMT